MRDLAALDRRTAEGWSPLPHQVPPSGDWYGWILLAGRGAGKTDACAHAMVNHVNGPPCMPGPVPHWMTVIGPTLGDAVRSCYEGPSGIRAHDPRAVMVNRAGGTVVHWPNGSEAKMFGAHSVEDTDRLRSGGNSSLPVGTLISTSRGQVPIEQVTTEDLVWTENGLRPVLGKWNHAVKPVMTITTKGGKTVRLTADHEVWVVGQGWTRADQLSVGGTLNTWNGMVTAGSDSVRTGLDRSRSMGSHAPSCFIGSSTNSITERSRKDGTSTTRTKTRTTMIRRTWKPVLRGDQGTISHNILSLASGMLREAEHPSPVVVGEVPVSSAENLSRGHIRRRDFAREVAGELFSRRMLRIAVCGHASCAEAISNVPKGPSPSLALDVVETISHGNIAVPVWDLTIAGEHDFVADGVLVSNCFAWCEELAAWRYLDQAYAQLRFGLRTGPHPRWVGSTTPRPRALIKKFAQKTPRNIAVTHATVRDNPHISPEFLESLLETYAGTTLAAQELEGRIIDQDENALWTREQIEAARVLPDEVPDLKKIVVGIDPSGGAGEQGIVVSGRATLWTPGANKDLTHGFVLDDRTCHLKPEGWGKRAVRAAIDWEADEILCEMNYGGDMVISTVRSAAELLGVPIPIKKITATRGKKVRAEPVAALTAQGRWHHAGVFPDLEDQMTTWHEDLDWSPDRIDASVWTAWGLKLAHLGGSGVGSIGSAAANRQIVGNRQ